MMPRNYKKIFRLLNVFFPINLLLYILKISWPMNSCASFSISRGNCKISIMGISLGPRNFNKE